MHRCVFFAFQADLFVEGSDDVEGWILDDGTPWEDLDGLLIPDFALAIIVDNQVSVDRHKLRLEKVAIVHSKAVMAHHIEHRRRQIRWCVQSEWHLCFSTRADVGVWLETSLEKEILLPR